MEGELHSSASAVPSRSVPAPRSASARSTSSSISVVDAGDSVSSKLLRFHPAKHFSVFKAALPLPADHTWTALITLMGRLQYVARQTRLICGDLDPIDWRPEWCSPVIRFLVSCVSSANVTVKEQTISKLLTLGKELCSAQICKDSLRPRRIRTPCAINHKTLHHVLPQ